LSSAYLAKNQLVSPAQIEWRDALPYSSAFDDIYFSPVDGLAETQYVFIDGCDLFNRWRQLAEYPYRILELGFGSGLNFFATCLAWQQFCQSRIPKPPPLHYFSVEKHPLAQTDILRTASHWPELLPFAKAFVAQQPDCHYGQFYLAFDALNIRLHLLQMPIEHALRELELQQDRMATSGLFDSIYLDGFAPSKNPDMWGESLSRQLAKLARTKATLATFSVAGAVRRPLASAGFTLSKRKGFAGKREMLTATYEAAKDDNQRTSKRINPRYDRPWFRAKSSPSQRQVAVIGAGIAGVTTAYLLQQRGFKVTLFEQGATVAAGASGVAAGIFHPQITADFNPLSELHWHAYRYHRQFLTRFDVNQRSEMILTHQVSKRLPSEQVDRIQQLLDALRIDNRWCEIKNNRVQFYQGGAINMRRYCETLAVPSANLQVLLQAGVKAIEQHGNGWQVDYLASGEKKSKSFDQLVLCTGSHQSLLGKELQESVHFTRGQALIIKSQKLAGQIRHSLCDDIYLVPQGNDCFYLGSTFESERNDQISDQSTQFLLHKLQQVLAREFAELNLSDNDVQILQAQLGYRLHTSDRAPLVGPMPDFDKLQNTFANWGQGSPRDRGQAYNRAGLWINCAYGSHGLLLSALCSEHLVSLMEGAPSPLSLHLQDKLHPARFFIRQLK